MAYREILFRGKYADKQILNAPLRNPEKIFPDKWVYGYYCPDMNDTPLGVVKHNPHIIKSGDPNEIYTGMWFAVKEDTVGEFTGILDDLGERIFEGDIVQVVIGKFAYNGVVEWQPNEARFLIHIKYDLNDWIPLDDQTVHIVGNIHDNPELLEA